MSLKTIGAVAGTAVITALITTAGFTALVWKKLFTEKAG